MAKNIRKKIRLNSTGLNKKGKKTGYFKTTTKKTLVSEKLKKKLFDPQAWSAEENKFGKHVLFEEGKI